jgi:hypothetical protein
MGPIATGGNKCVEEIAKQRVNVSVFLLDIINTATCLLGHL